MTDDRTDPPPLPAEDVSEHDSGFRRAAVKVREFPQTPGIYLMKDAAGRVIYVGKAKNLRSRAGSYFSKTAAEEMRTSYWINEICDIDYVECESEVDALLMESRLIKDVQPKYNKELKDDKTFPYLMITTREDFPRVEVTREPKERGVMKPIAPAFTTAATRPDRAGWSMPPSRIGCSTPKSSVIAVRKTCAITPRPGRACRPRDVPSRLEAV